MDDTINRRAAIETLDRFNVFGYVEEPWEKLSGALQALPSAQPEIIRCKECIHKPKPTEDYKQGERNSGFHIEFPDYMCPLQCEDPYYSRLPKDDWFCGNAESKEE